MVMHIPVLLNWFLTKLFWHGVVRLGWLSKTKSLDNKKYTALSLKIEEIGKMLGGWNGQLIKQNSPNK
jgi:hypothetical protein